jgi:hypothetical protein
MLQHPAPPSTPAALAAWIRGTFPDHAASASSASAAAQWIDARSPDVQVSLNPSPWPEGRRLRRPRASRPRIFSAGASEPFRRLSAFLDAVPAFLAALQAVAEPAAKPDDGHPAPLYTWTPPDMIGRPPAATWHTPLALRPRPDLLNPAGAVLDVLTGPVLAADMADYVDLDPDPMQWWPAVPAYAARTGVTVLTCPANEMLTGGWEALPAYVAALAQLHDRTTGYGRLFVSLRGVVPNPTRKPLQTAAGGYAALYAALLPVGDLLAADLAAFLSAALDLAASLQSLTQRIPVDDPMPPISAVSPSSISNLAGHIRDAITAGHGGRIQVTDQETAFSWSPGVAATLLNYVTTATAAGRRTTVVIAADTAAALTAIAEGGTKPDAVDFTSQDVDLAKYAGIASLSIESAQFVANIEAAVATVMTSRILRGIESATTAAILAGAGETVTGTDLTAAVLAAIAAIRSNGGAATVVGLSSEDWITLMTATGSSGYLNFSNPEAGPAGTWLGLYPVILPDLAAGSAVVLDGNAVTVLETAGGPLCVVDPFSQLGTNMIRIAIETWAVPVVTAPGGVAAVTVGP